jgi:hypothetical protein
MPNLSEVMRTNFITVAPEDTLGETAQKLVDANVGAAVVIDFGRLIGIISERDLLKAMAGRVHTSDARVREWMTEDPIVASPDTPIEEAAQTMLDNNFRRPGRGDRQPAPPRRRHAARYFRLGGQRRPGLLGLIPDRANLLRGVVVDERRCDGRNDHEQDAEHDCRSQRGDQNNPLHHCSQNVWNSPDAYRRITVCRHLVTRPTL